MSLKLNERYPGRFNNPSAAYPQGSFKNRTAPGAKDGSYLEQDWANDKEAFFQSVLAISGIAPNGTVDTVGNSQFFNALLKILQDQIGVAFTTGGAAPAFTLAPSPAITAYSANKRFRVKFSGASTGADTLNISGLGPKALKQYDAIGAKAAAVFAAGQLVDAEYDGVDVVLLNPLMQGGGLLDSTRINVASSANINLTTLAPNTRNINITGGGVVSGFTVGIGKCYFVRFAAIGVLTNSAALVTQSGINIAVQAGDTCVIRATAANTVEVLMYTPFIEQAIGYGQVPRNLVASRALSTVYTNTSGRPRFFAIRVVTISGSPSGNLISVPVSGGDPYTSGAAIGSGANYSLVVIGVIPPGSTYQATVPNATLVEWLELTV